MNKKILLLTICIVAVVLIALVVGVFVSRNLSGDVIKNKETALKIGDALLEERFGRSEPDYNLYVLEENEFWIVYSLPRQPEEYITSDAGGRAYVKFRKSDGKVTEYYIDPFWDS